MRTPVRIFVGPALLLALASACWEPPSLVEPPVTAAEQGAALEAPPLVGSMVAAGEGHACALGVDRRAYCWGDNSDGNLGDGSNLSSMRPVPVDGARHFAHLTSGGFDHTCGLTEDGEAYCWGWNAFGQLGDGTTASSNVPVAVAGSLRFAHLDAGSYHTCGLTEDGEAYCWGANGPLIRAFGGRGEDEGFALGAPTTELCDNPRAPSGSPYRGSPWPCSTTPLAVSGGISFHSISAGVWATCGVAEDGVAYCWGFNGADELGTGMATYATAPTAVAGGLLFDDVVLGALHGCGLVDEDAYCWGGRPVPGLANFGSLGTGSFDGSSAPAAVAGGLSFSAIMPSDANNVWTFTCGLTTDGAAYCWGSNESGALGTDAVLAPCGGAGVPCTNVPVPVAGGIEFISLASGSQFACGVAGNRATYCWGRNDFGQLGDGTTMGRFTPVLVQAPERREAVLAKQAQGEVTVIP